MILCFFGHFDPQYPRNRILKKGLELNGVQTIICRDTSALLKRFWQLYRKQTRLEYDVLFVPYSYLSAGDVLIAKIISIIRGRPLVYDAFISLYDTYVFDKKYCKKGSFRSYFYWILDWLSVHLPDLVICDTKEHCRYFSRHYLVSLDKFFDVAVGTDDSLFIPIKSKSHERKTTIVGYWGNYLPLHGLDYIIEAASIIQSQDKNIEFHLLGDGQEFLAIQNKVRQLGLENIKYHSRIPYEQLPKFIHSLDVVLGGPFGDSEKASRVIPNKVYEALACKKPVIVRDSEIMRNTFTSNEVYFCSGSNSQALAETIVHIKKNNKIALRYAENGFHWFEKNATVRAVGLKFKSIIQEQIKFFPNT